MKNLFTFLCLWVIVFAKAQNCPTPTNLALVNSNTLNATFTSDLVASANYYKFKISVLGSPNLMQVYSSSTPNFMAAALLPVTSYQVSMAAVCGAATSAFSAPVNFQTTASSGCGIPQSILATGITAAKVKLTWLPVIGASAYKINVSYTDAIGNPINKSYDSGLPYLDIIGLTPETAYSYTVTALCSNVPGLASVSQTFTTPSASTCAAPNGLVASNVGGTSAKIKWTALSGVNYYKLQYQVLGALNYSVQIVNGSEFTLNNLLMNTNYNIKVSSICSNLESASSPVGTFKTLGTACGMPTGINLTQVTASTATVNFTPSATGTTIKTMLYLTKIGQNVASAYTTTTNKLVLTGLSPNAQYSYQMGTVCGGYTGALTTSGSFTTGNAPTCAAPTNVLANAITVNSATINWTAVPGITSYTVKATLATGATTSFPTTKTSFKISGLSAGTMAQVIVYSNCLPGVLGGSSAPISFTTSAAINCASPNSLNVSNINVTKAKFSWTLVSGINQYKLQMMAVGSTTPIAYTVSGTSFEASNLQPNVTYAACVASVCNGVVGAFCPVTTFSTLLDGLCPPPLNLNASNITATSANLSWDSIPGTMSWKVFVHPYNFPSLSYVYTNVKSYKSTGLKPNTLYNAVVMANCPAGMFSGATTYTFTTPAQVCQDANEPNNTFLSATNLVAESPKTGGINGPNVDLDYYKITLTAAANNMKVSLFNLPKDFDLKIFNSQGVLLKLSENIDTISEIVVLNNLPAGTYYVQVFGFSGNTSTTDCYSIIANTSNIAYLGAGNTTPGSVSLTQANSIVTANEAEITKPTEDVIEKVSTPNFNFKISPNPLQDIAHIDFGTNFEGNISISIIDMSGKLISKDSLFVSTNNGAVMYDMSQLQNGMYIMVAQNSNIRKTFKVVVNK